MEAKQLISTGQMWIYYVKTCIYAYNSIASPSLKGLSPFHLSRPPKVLIDTNLPKEELDPSKNTMSYQKRICTFYKNIG